ncbi:hypothetical protein T552_01180 [Pneumocystis carinii B80]|uniref:RNA helicase n=1 Tax=Pneumocystis carinii (strain B80) TaxID=1408658 RepID=A0A0W4ZLG2_PNEC8|nr:hypothetical protein T552_01180 [Pneumocystis carinii B80]KTW29224.1 hypothetical protein T552_01180 [Pneumocystis carinii B80]
MRGDLYRKRLIETFYIYGRSLSAKIPKKKELLGPFLRNKFVGNELRKRSVEKRDKEYFLSGIERFGFVCMGRSFFSAKKEVEREELVKKGFLSLGLMSSIVNSIYMDGLRSFCIEGPTKIQILAIPEILKCYLKKTSYRTFILAAETGSGKTLAYISPILHILKLEERDFEGSGELRCQGKPRCIIIVPTAELVKQIHMLLKRMSHGVKIRSSFVMSGCSLDFIKKNVLTSFCDILVATPFQIYKFIEEKKLNLDQTRYMVLDEADSLMDISFRSIVLSILNSANNLKLRIFCSSVVSQKYERFLLKHYPDIYKIVTPELHTISKKISFRLIDAQKTFKNNKKMACLSILERIAKNDVSKKVIIFFNERKHSDEFAYFLKDKGFHAFSLTKYTKDRLNNIHNFIYGNFSDKSLSILVTTDLNSRGVDTVGLKNVILFDLPYNHVDLIHRLGRTGRAGKSGKAYLIYGKGENYQWIKKTQESIRIGKPLI